MRSNEGKFRTRLVKALREAGYFAQPIESGGTANGIPDLYLRAGYFDGVWIELKSCPKTSWPTHRKIDFRPLQHHWLRTHFDLGGGSYVTTEYSNAIVTASINFIDKVEQKYNILRPLLIQPKIDAQEYCEFLAGEADE
jgi:hypothetical protein